MLTILDQADEYMAETVMPEPGTAEWAEWAKAFRVEVDTHEDYERFSVFCGKNMEEIDEHTEFLSGERDTVDWDDVAVEMFSYSVMREIVRAQAL